MLRFDWDPAKATANVKKHGVSFEEASTAFGDPFQIDIDDPDHSGSEDRFIIIGKSDRGRLLITAYSEAEPSHVRIITSRNATRRERKDYEKA
ncbi:MAG TPA: BrnT family toxin [Candidatus Elarobacter sp.]|nr:BrnT family toxin [Candidatus Elarobacter sp.]